MHYYTYTIIIIKLFILFTTFVEWAKKRSIVLLSTGMQRIHNRNKCVIEKLCLEHKKHIFYTKDGMTGAHIRPKIDS